MTLLQLSALHLISALASVTVTDLVRSLGTRAAATSAMVTRLIHAGLVCKTPDPQDRRRVQLTLTAEAEPIVGDTDLDTARRLQAALNGISPQTDIDIQHRSTPTLLSTRDDEWWFTLARTDEWTHPHQHGDTELLIDVHNTIQRLSHVQHVLRTQEIESNANRLLTERHRAQILGASVLHDLRGKVA
jgi:DNA-binding MarR family transcriptional regulator